VNLILDTHVLLWWLAGDPGLGEEARSAIAAEVTTVFVSAASAWEISIKRALGKLEAPHDLEDQITQHRFEPLSITVAHASSAGALPAHHDDPFDRMLVAQGLAEDLTIVTRDPRIRLYGIPTLAA
jgi:PIN domain nuclease of toxin-antitoxin system